MSTTTEILVLLTRFACACAVLLDSTTYSILVLISLAGEGTVFKGQGIESRSDNCDYRYGNITLIHCLPGLPRSELHLPQGLQFICFSCCSFSSPILFPRGDVMQGYVQPAGSRRLLRRSLALLSESNNRDSPALIDRYGTGLGQDLSPFYRRYLHKLCSTNSCVGFESCP